MLGKSKQIYHPIYRFFTLVKDYFQQSPLYTKENRRQTDGKRVAMDNRLRGYRTGKIEYSCCLRLYCYT